MDQLNQLAIDLGAKLKRKGYMLALAESCTGGMAAQWITSVPGSSMWFDRGFVTYSNQSKIEMLGVQAETIEQYGAVSEQTAIEMVYGALKQSQAKVAVSITGIAGPDGGSLTKPVGTVCFAWASLDGGLTKSTKWFGGDRAQIRQQACIEAMQGLLTILA
ncbi:MAG TPA: damage-inducible protein CinA [Methylophilaceae bacterium]|nr:damage-inducible protein CinA [Methylophilaceae bacterium]HAJ73154.1 damage-inducible protein CinA [Methylophilaceae bacterium]